MIHGIREAAKYLEISERTIYRMIDEGTFPKPSKVEKEDEKGRKYRCWKEKDLENFRIYLRSRGRPLQCNVTKPKEKSAKSAKMS